MISKYMVEINENIEKLNKLLVSNDYFKKLEERINKVNELYLKQIEITTELNSKVMLKDKQIKEALRIIEEKRGEYDIPEELEKILKEDE